MFDFRFNYLRIYESMIVEINVFLNVFNDFLLYNR